MKNPEKLLKTRETNLFFFSLNLFLTGADSLAYLSVEGLKRAVKFNMSSNDRNERSHCTACLTGDYPGGVPEELSW